MKILKSPLLTTLTLVLGLSNSLGAQAATVTSAGVWSSVSISDASELEGLGNQKISWGTPASEAGKSAYIFEGVNSIALPTNGSKFLLGTFSHENFAVFPPSINSAELQISLSINNGSISAQDFNFVFDHEETTNRGENGICPSTPGFYPPCPDLVTLPEPIAREIITIGGENYRLKFEGFEQNGELVQEFITLEDNINVAQLFGSLQRFNPDPGPGGSVVPEPTSLLGLVVLGIGASLGKLKRF